MNKINLIVLLTVILIGINGCKRDGTSTANQAKSNFVDSSISDLHNLGWIGASSHPLKEIISFEDPGSADKSPVSPGGVVICEVFSDSPAAEAGLKAGDVIVGWDDKWMPVNDDPTLEFLKQIELQITAGAPETALRVYRSGKCESVAIKNISNSLDKGLPSSVVRFTDATTGGLKHLATLQNKDGSFGDKALSLESKLQITSLAGMALLCNGDEQFVSNVDNCKSFIGKSLDSLVKETKEETKDEPEQDSTVDSKKGSDEESKIAKEEAEEIAQGEGDEGMGGMMMQSPPELDLDPLTAAYVSQFLSETGLPIFEKTWMPRRMGLMGVISDSQSPSGGWNVTEGNEAADAEIVLDLEATHTTNQVVLALGMIERMGMSGDPELLKNACGFLNKQTEIRNGSQTDRRLKSALTAGTAAAFKAINVSSSDSEFQAMLKDVLDNSDQLAVSPSLTLPGLLSTAILSKQTGKESWTTYYNDNKYWLASTHRPDGSFNSLPISSGSNLDLVPHAADPAWESAHYCLLMGMQASKLGRLTGATKSPMMALRSSSGERKSGGGMMDGRRQDGFQGQSIQMTLEDLQGEGTLEDKIKAKLKEMGMDVDGMDMKIESSFSGELPPGMDESDILGGLGDDEDDEDDEDN